MNDNDNNNGAITTGQFILSLQLKAYCKDDENWYNVYV